MQGVAPQNRHIASLTHAFLNVHWDRESPLLLGYSGGPDSKALLYALLECGITPHLAHVDHGWRDESAEEAEVLRGEAHELGCPFHSVRVEGKKGEDEARKARFSFFASLASQYQALLLAHQAEDLAETVLKRIFEGAHLVNLGGMQAVSRQYGMTIWRPFLKVRRAEVLEFLKERSLISICDPTNSDPKYLRTRIRYEIFPFLRRAFGKEITENLSLLSERSFELKTYLDQHVNSVPVHRGPWGILIDLNGFEPIEQCHFLQKIAKEEALIILSRPVLQALLDWVKKGSKSKYLVVQTTKILVDGGKIFLQRIQVQDANNKPQTI